MDASRTPSWDDKLISEVTYLDKYEFIIQFKDRCLKLVNIEPYIKTHRDMFAPIISDNASLKNFQYDLIELYWNDIMGIEAQTLYDMGKDIDRKTLLFSRYS